MPFSAYLLGVSQIGKEKEVLEKCMKIKGVREGTVVFGEFDIILKIEAEDLKELSRKIEEIRKINGFIRTITLIPME
ncbi:MAG: Lrp/AsnC ligand binding domain-containing protein [Candidatus Methanomethyliaceae archaeon]|nr:Lrp/AsnC ligand binding domain-containing protein [Candidatus Methanomethyliaceae archaeon]MDW7970962.1 Lrp/AsnC ligand binding domain-containing protein [Nitrososphaerota archaeon]